MSTGATPIKKFPTGDTRFFGLYECCTYPSVPSSERGLYRQIIIDPVPEQQARQRVAEFVYGDADDARDEQDLYPLCPPAGGRMPACKGR